MLRRRWLHTSEGVGTAFAGELIRVAGYVDADMLDGLVD
jgi:hypothetical protein